MQALDCSGSGCSRTGPNLDSVPDVLAYRGMTVTQSREAKMAAMLVGDGGF